MILVRAVKVTAAAILLWFDWRLFALYAFLLLLVLRDELNRVRAMARCYQISTDTRWLAALRKLDVTQGDIAAMARAYKEQSDTIDIARDWALASGRDVDAETLFDSVGAYEGFLKASNLEKP